MIINNEFRFQHIAFIRKHSVTISNIVNAEINLSSKSTFILIRIILVLVTGKTQNLVVERDGGDSHLLTFLSVLVVPEQAELDVVPRLLLTRPGLILQLVSRPGATATEGIEEVEFGEVLVKLQDNGPGLDIPQHWKIDRGCQA